MALKKNNEIKTDELNLEKLELVVEKSGASYADAKLALENNDYSVIDAVIELDEKAKNEAAAKATEDSEMMKKVKKIVKKGNVCRLIIKKNDSIILNVPLNVTIVGTLLVPWATIFSAIATAGFNCTVEFVNEQGIITDLNGKFKGTYNRVANVGKKAVNKAKDVVENVAEEIKK